MHGADVVRLLETVGEAPRGRLAAEIPLEFRAKRVGETRDYRIDCSRALQDEADIITDWAVQATGAAIVSQALEGADIVVRLAGGVACFVAWITVAVSTGAGDVVQRTITLPILAD